MNRSRNNYSFKTKPYRHQVRALKKVIRNNGGALFMPMRSGKTKVAVDWVGATHMKYGITRVLVVCPKSVKGVWKTQIRRHLPDELRENIQWMIINYEQLYARKRIAGSWVNGSNPKLYEWDPQAIIVDESHKIGDPSTLQSKEVYKLQKKLGVRFKLILTGTPFHRKPLKLFGQFKFLDDGIFGTSYTPFKREYALWGGYGGFQVLKYLNEDRMMQKISRKTFLLRHVPPVPPQYEEVTYPLEESDAKYAEMAKEAVIEALDLEAENPLARATRLSQLCSGRMPNSDGKIVTVGGEKRRAFEGLVEQFTENEVDKFVVFSRWLPPFRDIVEVVRAAGYRPLLFHGGVSESDREQRIAEFEETEDKTVFLAQTATGSMGIDLSSASIAVFYTLPSSLVDWDQDHARIRKYRDQRTLTYYYLLAEGTVEMAQFLAHKEGLDLVEMLEKHPELLAYKEKL